MRTVECILLICCCFWCFTSSCVLLDTVEFFRPEEPPAPEETYRGYYETELGVSSAADVLGMIYLPEYELLSDSPKVIASVGEKKIKSYKRWFKMVAFDEDEFKARRKYLFVEDERPKFLFKEPWEGARFESALLLKREVLDEPYADDNARRIAILKQVLKDFRADFDGVRLDNKVFRTLAMLVNQGLDAALVKLDASPALARRLSELSAVEFSHINYDRGKIQMFVLDDTVTVKMQLGAFVKDLMSAEKYRCTKCGYVYDPVVGDAEHGVKAGTSFEMLPEDWVCPKCGAGKGEKMWKVTKR